LLMLSSLASRPMVRAGKPSPEAIRRA
jgi:hypothetical protein